MEPVWRSCSVFIIRRREGGERKNSSLSDGSLRSPDRLWTDGYSFFGITSSMTVMLLGSVHWYFKMEEVRRLSISFSNCMDDFLFQILAFAMGLGIQEVLGYLCIFANGLSKLPQVLQPNFWRKFKPKAAKKRWTIEQLKDQLAFVSTIDGRQKWI